MTKYQSLIVYGLLIVMTGTVLLIFEFNASPSIRFPVALGILSSAVFAMITTVKSKNLQVPFKYHGMHALGLTAFAASILILGTDVLKLLNITAFFMLFFGITELIFGMQLLMLKASISLPILIFRLVIGFAQGLGSIVILQLSYLKQSDALLGSGIGLVVAGISIISFKTILQVLDVPDAKSPASILQYETKNH
jgi:hypothetical protein